MNYKIFKVGIFWEYQVFKNGKLYKSGRRLSRAAVKEKALQIIENIKKYEEEFENSPSN